MQSTISLAKCRLNEWLCVAEPIWFVYIYLAPCLSVVFNAGSLGAHWSHCLPGWFFGLAWRNREIVSNLFPQMRRRRQSWKRAIERQKKRERKSEIVKSHIYCPNCAFFAAAHKYACMCMCVCVCVFVCALSVITKVINEPAYACAYMCTSPLSLSLFPSLCDCITKSAESHVCVFVCVGTQCVCATRIITNKQNVYWLPFLRSSLFFIFVFAEFANNFNTQMSAVSRNMYYKSSTVKRRKRANRFSPGQTEKEESC